MRILVTGGAGYLGSILVEVLLTSWIDEPTPIFHEVTVLDNFRHGANSLAHLCSNERLTIVRGDARDTRTLEALVPKAEAIFPLAALVGAPLCDLDHHGAITTNDGAIESLCEIASKDQPIIIPITNSGYGIGKKGTECTEESPLRPLSLYGRTKVEAEALIMGRGNAVSIRLATLFGMSPRMRLDLLVNDMVYRAVRDRFVVLYEADAMRNYLHVRDAAEAFVHAIRNWETMKNSIYNVGLSAANLSKRELCARIKEHVPSFTVLESPVGSDVDKRDYMVSNAKIEATGWRPSYSLDDGIRELIQGYQMIRNERYANV